MRLRRSVASLVAMAVLAACDTASGPDARHPAELEVAAGDLQTATVGAQAPAALQVRVQDARGRGVPDVPVSFAVTAGGGSLSAASAVTNADGVAETRWTLGTVAGDTQRVEARVTPDAGDPPLTLVFRAVATAGPPAAVAPVGGGAAAGIVGQPMADSLAARVSDAYDNPVAGAAVVWAVRSGEGALSAAATTTDARGIARTHLTLGARLDSATVVEAAAGLTLATTVTVTPRPSPTALVLAKASGDAQEGTAGEPLERPVVVRVTLPDGRPVRGAPVAFTADAGGTVTPPAAVTDADGRATAVWTLGDAGPHALLAFVPGGPQASFLATVRGNRPPILVVASPTANAAVSATVPIQASCTDAETACKVTVRRLRPGQSPVTLAQATGAVNLSFDASAFLGQTVTFEFEAADAYRLGSQVVTRTVSIVESCAACTPVRTVPGQVMDIAGSHILSGQVISLPSSPVYTVSHVRTDLATGVQTSLGTAYYGSYPFAPPSDWLVNGALRTAACPAMRAAGYGLREVSPDRRWVTGFRVPTQGAVCDAVADTFRVLGPAQDAGIAVAAGGIVALRSADSLYLVTGGVRTALATGNVGSPSTDGTRVAYRTRSGSTYTSHLHDPAVGIVALSAATTVVPEYRVRNGWVAYTAGGSVRQVHLRAPGGTTRQVSSSAVTCSIEDLSDDGDVAFRCGSRVYAASATGTPVDAGPAGFDSHRTAWFVGRTLYVAPSSTVYRITY